MTANLLSAPTQPVCLAVNLGVIEYREAWDLQRRIASEVAAGERPGTLLLAEHPHVYTLGRSTEPSDLPSDGVGGASLRAPVVDVDRGGRATYHGPGQVVCYPVVRLRPAFRGPLAFLRALEEAVVVTLSQFGIAAAASEGATGVWAGEAKIAAIGLRVSRGVTTHGVALNVDPDLSYFDHVAPCGDPDARVTSMAVELRRPVCAGDVAPVLAGRLAEVCGWRMAWAEPETLRPPALP